MIQWTCRLALASRLAIHFALFIPDDSRADSVEVPLMVKG